MWDYVLELSVDPVDKNDILRSSPNGLKITSSE